MVEVRVGVEYGVDFGEILSQCLFPQVRAAVDEDGEFWCLEMDGGAGAGQAWVVRGADWALAADDGDAGGCAGAEEGEGSFRFQLGLSFA